MAPRISIFGSVLFVTLSALLAPRSVRAVETSSTAEALPTPTNTSTPSPALTPPPKEQTPAAPASSPGFPLKLAGFLKAGPLITKRVESFNQPNAAAVTAAVNPVFLADNIDKPALTFQAAQTRLQFIINDPGPMKGLIEIDFMDVTKASPTVASIPRLRIATIIWKINENHTLEAGQNWDLFAPLNPPTANYVGALFFGGNVGFMRQQVQYRYDDASLHLGAAIGLAGVNNNAALSTLEIGFRPTIALRASYDIAKLAKIGISGIATQWKALDDDDRRAVGAVSVHADLTPWTGGNIRAEGYFGQNLGTIGSLALGLARTSTDAQELGGWLSIKQAVAETHNVYAMIGGTRILNDIGAFPGYSRPMMGAPTRTTAGIRRNMAVRAGYEYRPNKSFALFFEGFLYRTRHVLLPADTGLDATQTGYGAEIGLLFNL